VRTAGLVLGVVGAGLALRSGLLVAGRGRPQRGPRPALVLAGPYLYLRNPLLAGVVVTLAGIALANGSRVLAAAALAAALVAHAWIVGREEPLLRARFGPAYEEYLRRVPRWLPRRPAET
jgi:protein-S-isoprenylcysteine O-methyltransferase Ste14